jgi:phage major head subunit gpT-like protein
MGIAPTALVCGPTLERKAREILQADTRVIATDSTGKEATTMVVDTTTIQNIWQGELKLIIDERLSGTYAYYWYLLDENAAKMAAPIIIQENRKPEPHILNKNDMDGETRFWTDRFIYSLEGDFGFDAGAWQPIYGNLATS